MSAIPRLPEELLRDILAYLLSTDEETFCAFRHHGLSRSRGSTYRELVTHCPAMKINPLLVSKQWLRIGTALLYEKVLLFETSRTKIIAQLVKANPAIGRAIRYLRLEGGMGRDLLTIVTHAPNIHTIWITPNVRGSESIAGLKKAIPLLQPRRLYVSSLNSKPCKASEEIEKLLVSSIAETWTSLTSVTFWNTSCMGSDLCEALCKAPVLQEISMGITNYETRWITCGYLATIVKNIGLQRVTFVKLLRYTDLEVIEDAMKKGKMNDHQRSLVKFIDIKAKSVWAKHLRFTGRTPAESAAASSNSDN